MSYDDVSREVGCVAVPTRRPGDGLRRPQVFVLPTACVLLATGAVEAERVGEISYVSGDTAPRVGPGEPECRIFQYATTRGDARPVGAVGGESGTRSVALITSGRGNIRGTGTVTTAEPTTGTLHLQSTRTVKRS